MKTCPICKTAYEDDTLEKCANEGATLAVADSAPADAITSDIDVKKVKTELEKPAVASATSAAPVQKPGKKTGKKDIWIVAAIILLVLLASTAAFYFWFYKGNLIEVNLHSVPPGAEVMLDGKKIGTTPLLVRIKKGTHQVVFEHIDHLPVKETLHVTEDGHVLVKKMVPIVNPSP